MRNIVFVGPQENETVLQETDNDNFPFPRKALTDKRLHASSVKLLVGLYYNCVRPMLIIPSGKRISQLAGLAAATGIKSLQELGDMGYLLREDNNFGTTFTFPQEDTDMVSIHRAGWATLLRPNIRGTSSWVFLLISSNAENGSTKLSYSQICETICVSRSNVSLVINQLEQLGVLKIDRRHDANGMRSINHYSIVRVAS